MSHNNLITDPPTKLSVLNCTAALCTEAEMFGVETALISIKGIHTQSKLPEHYDHLTSSLLITHAASKICQIYVI